MTLFIIIMVLGAGVLWSLLSDHVSIKTEQVFTIIYFAIVMTWVFAVCTHLIEFP